MPNRIVALVQLLKNDSAVAAIAGARIYDHELPDSQVPRMPRPSLVVRPAGGANSIGQGYAQYSDERVDVRHYGYTPSSAYDLFIATRDALHYMSRIVIADTVLHWARESSGPIQMREHDGMWSETGVPDNTIHWPFVLASWQVLAADIAPEVD